MPHPRRAWGDLTERGASSCLLKVAPLWHDLLRLSRQCTEMLPVRFFLRDMFLQQHGQPGRQILDLLGDDMDDVGFRLQFAGDTDEFLAPMTMGR